MKSTSSNEEDKKIPEPAAAKPEKQVVPLFEELAGEWAKTSTALDHFFSWLRSLWKKIAFSYLQAIDKGHYSLVTAAMQKKFSFWLHLLFAGCFKADPLPETDILRVRECAKQGTIVYVMYCRSTLDYLYCNFLYLRAGLPLAQFANGMDLTYFLPFPKFLRALIARFFFRRERGKIPDPLTQDKVRQMIAEHTPFFLFLTRSRSLLSTNFGFHVDPLPVLLEVQKKADFPIFIIPQTILWQKKPDTLRERSLFEVIFGDPDAPGVVRKLVHFLRYYRSAQVKMGEALDLKQFLSDQEAGLKSERIARRVRWLLRHYLYRERKAVSGPLERDRVRVIARIIRHKDVQEAIERWGMRTGKSREEGKALAQKYIFEIVPDRRWGMIALADRILRVVWKIFYDGVVFDSQQLERVRNSVKDSPVVFVASHKSHMDYLVSNWVFFRNDIIMPYVCAGINLNFWPLGPIFRRTGAYFIRRSYPEPEIYPAVLERYIRELMIAGQAQLFFIEGGRSRTGKLLRAKLGILSKVVEGYRAGVCKDVVVVPVAVGYDRILEGKSYSDEAKGSEKSKEDIGGLIRFFQRMIRSRYGKIYVNCDEPISLADYLQKNADTKPSTPSKTSLPMTKTSTTPPWLLEKLAGRICFGINRVSVVFPAAFVALLLLSHRKRGLSRVEITQGSQPLIRYLERRKVRFSDAFRNHEAAFDLALRSLREGHLINPYEDQEFAFFTVDESKRLLLNYYKNNIVHFFVTFSLLAGVLVSLSRRKGESGLMEFSEIEKEYEFLRALFKYEFYFRPKEALSGYVRGVIEFFAAEKDLEFVAEKIKVTAKGRQSLEQYREIAYNFFESYALILTLLKRFQGKTVEDKALVRDARHYGRRLFLQGKIERVESLSQFTLQNAFLSLTHKGLIAKTERKGTYRVIGTPEQIATWSEPLASLMDQKI